MTPFGAQSYDPFQEAKAKKKKKNNSGIGFSEDPVLARAGTSAAPLKQSILEPTQFQPDSVEKTNVDLIRKREKRTAELIKQGYSEKTAREKAAKEVGSARREELELARSGIYGAGAASFKDLEELRKSEFARFLKDVEAKKGEIGPSELEELYQKYLRETGGETPESLSGEALSSIDSISEKSPFGMFDNLMSSLNFNKLTKKDKEQLETTATFFEQSQQMQAEYKMKRETGETLDKGMEKGLRVVGDVDVFGLSTEGIVDALTGRQDIEPLLTGIGKYGTVATTIEGIHASNGDSTAKSIARLNQLNKELAIMEYKIKLASIMHPTVLT